MAEQVCQKCGKPLTSYGACESFVEIKPGGRLWEVHCSTEKPSVQGTETLKEMVSVYGFRRTFRLDNGLEFTPLALSLDELRYVGVLGNAGPQTGQLYEYEVGWSNGWSVK